MVMWFAFPEVDDNFSLQNLRSSCFGQREFDKDMRSMLGPTHGPSGVHT